MAKHDENKDVRLISGITKINTINKTIKAPKGAIIGIRTWGRIDFLTNYCGYTFIWDNSVGTKTSNVDDSSTISKNIKKNKKDYQTTNKTKHNKYNKDE